MRNVHSVLIARFGGSGRSVSVTGYQNAKWNSSTAWVIGLSR